MSQESYLLKRIESIEEDIARIKEIVSGDERSITSLRGIWEGVEITDEEIEEAKKSLFKEFEE